MPSYKFITSGQNADNAPVIAQVLNGVSIKPFAPANVRGARGSANDLLIEMEGRTRIDGGIRPYQSGATSEETEEYRAQVLNGGSVTLPNGKTRILPLVVGASQSAVFVVDTLVSSHKFDNVNVNTFSASGAGYDLKCHALQRILSAGNFFEATLNASGDGAATLSLVSTDGSTSFAIAIVPALTEIFVSINGAANISVGTYDPAAVDVRLRITASGSEVRFYQDYSGAGTPPIYVSGKAPSFPLIPTAEIAAGSGGTVSIAKATLTTYPYPKTIYSAAQQVEDFGSTQSAIQIDAWQESRRIGAGMKRRVTL